MALGINNIVYKTWRVTGGAHGNKPHVTVQPVYTSFFLLCKNYKKIWRGLSFVGELDGLGICVGPSASLSGTSKRGVELSTDPPHRLVSTH